MIYSSKYDNRIKTFLWLRFDASVSCLTNFSRTMRRWRNIDGDPISIARVLRRIKARLIRIIIYAMSGESSPSVIQLRLWFNVSSTKHSFSVGFLTMSEGGYASGPKWKWISQFHYRPLITVYKLLNQIAAAPNLQCATVRRNFQLIAGRLQRNYVGAA